MPVLSNQHRLNIFIVLLITALTFFLISWILPTERVGNDKNAAFTNVSATHLKSSNTKNNSMDGQTIDIDKDGDMDMVIAMEWQSNVILINDGTGKLEDESSERFPSIVHDSEDIAIADFDLDGDDDIVFVSEDDQINEYYINIGDGYFEESENIFPVKGTSNAVEALDLDNDGDQDLLIGNAGQNFVLINQKGVFKDATEQYLPSNNYTTQDLELGDIDSDGDLDLLEGNETYNRILINDGAGHFTYQKGRIPYVNDQTRDAEFGDADGDGDLDIFFSNVDFGDHGDPQNRLLLNNGNGFFKEVTSTHLPISKYRTVDSDFIDIDKDGDLDLLCGNRFNGPSMLVLINDGKGKFTDQTKDILPNLNCYVFDYQASDFNGDGVQDLYFCGFRGDDVLLFGNKK